MAGDAPFDLLAMGRMGVDVYPQQTGVGLEDVTSFGKHLGGSACNVAVAAARHGRRVAIVSGVGTDPFGRFVRRELGRFGVDDRYVREVAELPTPVTFCEIFPPDNFPIWFYRWPSAPDLQIRVADLDLDAVRAARICWVTVTGLCQQPSRAATLGALAARGRNGMTILDLDWRSMFWESVEDARPIIEQALTHATVAVGNLDECEVAVGERDPQRAAAALRAFGVRLAVIKQGPAGVYAVDEGGEVHVPPMRVEVVNGLGAGDAFGGALCHGLLAGWDTARCIRFANAAGAIVASRLACAEAMPTTDEVEQFLAAAEQLPRRPLVLTREDADVKLHLPHGTATRGPWVTHVMPEQDEWSHTSLRVLELPAGGAHRFTTNHQEMVVLPLSGAAVVDCDGVRMELAGRASVFAAVSDFAYVPNDSLVTVSSVDGGRFAVAGAVCERRLTPRYGAAADVPVELRGAGAASRQVNNFCTPASFEADKLIAVEVLTPGGNWSSYPPHKHDEERPGVETALEEIYYVELSRPGGLAYLRVYGQEDRPIDVLAEVGTGDVVLIPHGWHGPAVTAPGVDMYYLNVMAGPGPERAWRICDDPAHAAVRDEWVGVPIDPRLPLTSA